MDVSYDCSDETVIVTGGSSGIGRAVARRFGEAGATVLNADVRETPKDVTVEGRTATSGGTVTGANTDTDTDTETAPDTDTDTETAPDTDTETPTHELVSASGGRGVYVETDVSAVDDIECVVEAAREFGGVDVMVNNAGIFRSGNILDCDPTDFDALHAVNARGVFYGTQIAATDMLQRDVEGTIINTASISADLAQFDHVQYDATKGAVRMITRGAALELGEHGIRVNAVAPGHVGTEISEGWSEEAHGAVQRGDVIKPVPLARAATPDDVAGAYLFLASDEARYVTGELLYVDGGLQVF